MEKRYLKENIKTEKDGQEKEKYIEELLIKN